MPPVIHWFRRDLRIADNTALYNASLQGHPVIPVYILSSWKKKHAWTGANRQHFLCGCLESLSKNLGTVGGKLIVLEGEAVSVLKKLTEDTGAKAIHFNRDPDPFGKEVEAKVAKMCRDLGIECHAYDDIALHAPDEIFTGSDNPYKVFTPYYNNWITRNKPEPLGRPKSLETPSGIESMDIPTVSHWDLKEPTADLPEPGESAARKRMSRTVSTIIREYADARDIPSTDGTSRLSQDLRHGLISIRTLYRKIGEEHKSARGGQRDSIEIYIKELAWREFYLAVLHHFPHVLDHEFKEDWKGLPWDEPGENFEKWKNGQTGFPIVDAGMRQLIETGFMHNRIRMITAMFLTKDLPPRLETRRVSFPTTPHRWRDRLQ